MTNEATKDYSGIDPGIRQVPSPIQSRQSTFKRLI
mgnify:CR=1 FL=1